MTQRNLKLFPILLWHVLSEGDGTVGAAIQRVIHTRDLTGCYLGHRLLQVVRDSGDLAPPASDTPGVQVE
jgi:hypothetical protein